MEARKIIITGGSTRIGAAIARKLSGANKEIIIHYNKSKSKAENLKKKLEYYGAKVYLAKGDLSKEKDIIKIIKFINDYFALILTQNVIKNTYKIIIKHIVVNLLCI